MLLENDKDHAKSNLFFHMISLAKGSDSDMLKTINSLLRSEGCTSALTSNRFWKCNQRRAYENHLNIIILQCAMTACWGPQLRANLNQSTTWMSSTISKTTQEANCRTGFHRSNCEHCNWRNEEPTKGKRVSSAFPLIYLILLPFQEIPLCRIRVTWPTVMLHNTFTGRGGSHWALQIIDNLWITNVINLFGPECGDQSSEMFNTLLVTFPARSLSW